MATPFKYVKCFMDNTGSRVVYWAFNKLYPYKSDAALYVEYSQTSDQWQKISQDVKDQFLFVDTRKTNYEKVDKDFYRLHYVVNDHQEYYSQPVPAGCMLDKRQYALLKNINRLAFKQMKLTGRQGLLLKKKTYGPPCTTCKHFDNDLSVNQHCPQCLGTGIQGGFFAGIPYPILPQQTDQLLGVLPQGYSQGITVTARGVAWAYLQHGDVWVDRISNRRYNIDQIGIASSFKHIPTLYKFSLHLIEQTDVMHSKEADDLAKPGNVQGTWLEEFRVL